MEAERELAQLIGQLADAPLLTKDEARDLSRANVAQALSKMEQGQTFGEASGGLSILNQPEGDFRAELRSIDNDLPRQIGIVHESLDNWFAKGEQPAPYYPWRIAIILGKAKRKQEEAAFLAAWCKHFGAIVGGRYEKLAERARKLGAY